MPRRHTTQRLSKMGRRRFVNALAGLGVSTAAISGLSQEAMADLVDDPKKEVPRVLGYVHTDHEAVKNGASPDREALYYTISREQWVRIESAHDARQQVEQQLDGRFDDIKVWVTTNSNDEKRIDVEVYDDGSLSRKDVEAVEGTTPGSITGVAGRGTEAESAVEGIPVAVERINIKSEPQNPVSLESDQEFPDDYYYASDWDNIPAGAACFFADADGQGGVGTTCVPVDDGDVKKMLTAGHNLSEMSVDGELINPSLGLVWLEDDSPYHFLEDEVVFDDDERKNVLDAGTMHNTSGNALEYEFATNHGTTSGDIIGTLSRERIKDIEDDGTWDDEMTYHQGARTGEERGYGIEKVNDNAFQTDIPHDSVQQGDSGGPYYVRNTSSVSPTPFDLIMGVHSWSDADENTWGTIMEVIEDELGVEV